MPAIREKILIVDSNPDVLELLGKQTLGPLGYQVATALDGATAMDQVKRFKPDAVLASLDLPGISGKDLLVAFRAQGTEIPVVVISDRGREAEVIQAFRLGAVDFLARPVREAEAVATVERALQGMRLRREREQLAGRLGEANQQLERRVKELTTLYAMGKAVTSVTRMDELFDKLVDGALFVTEAEMCWLILPDDDGRPLLYAQKNMPAFGANRLRQPWDDGLTPLVMRSGEPLSIAGEPIRQFKVSHLAQSALVAPIKAKDQTMGVITVAHKTAKPFSERDQAMLSAVADYASVALVNARLFQALEARARSLQRAVDEVRANERVKDELIQNVGHELRTPLVHAKGYVDLLVRGDLGEVKPEQGEALTTVAAKLDAVVKLVDDMELLRGGQITPPKPEALSLTDAAKQAMARAQAAAKEAGIALIGQFPSADLRAMADPAQLSRVFDNLLANAVKFSPAGGQVTVRVDDPGDGTLKGCVVDTGLGIMPEHLPRIFDRFYQADGSTTRRFGGAGLGLAVVKQIVEAHGGRVWAESQPGKGSAFYFTVLKA